MSAPSPLAGEGKGEGASQVTSRPRRQAERPPHPAAGSAVVHLLPQGEKEKAPRRGEVSSAAPFAL